MADDQHLLLSLASHEPAMGWKNIALGYNMRTGHGPLLQMMFSEAKERLNVRSF